jgi:hypothetical protein
VEPEAWGAQGGRRTRTLASGSARRPASDVFVLRTRNGGWAKLVILARAQEGGWQERPVTVSFVFNPHEPRFEAHDGRAVRENGVLLAPASHAPGGK